MGRFTAAIVDGLETGSADRDRDGQISLYDLVRHVKTVVKHQTPQFLAARASGDPLIARSPSTATPLLDAGALTDLASDNWRHRLGAVAYLASVLKGKDDAAAAAARDLLQRRLNEERDVEVRQRIEEALNAASPAQSGPQASEVKVPEAKAPETIEHPPQESPKPPVDLLPASATDQVRAAVVAPGVAAAAAIQRRNKLWGGAIIGLVAVALAAWLIYVRSQPEVVDTVVAMNVPTNAPPLVRDSPALLNPKKDTSADPPAQTSAASQQPALLAGRYVLNACGSITDTTSRLEWYVGSDTNFSWQEAARWSSALQACGGGWSLPTETQAATLYDRAKSAGRGYYTDNRYFPAHIDPVFSGIGGGSWIWLRAASAQGQSPAYNLNQNVAVKFASDGSQYPTRAFAVREARSQ